MRRRSQIAFLSIGIAASIGSVVRADDTPAPSPANTPGDTVGQPRATEFSPGVTPSFGTAPYRPLMGLFHQSGIGQGLDSARINVFGWVEGSYEYNFARPQDDLNLGRVFDVQDNRAQINQIDLSVERRVDLHSGQFDVGGRIDMLYGTDSQFIHSNGIFDTSDFFSGPEYQFDIPQLYADFALPVGTGLQVRAGKFLFFKQIDPNASVFYTHSFIFGGALPFTNTGVTAKYQFCPGMSFEGGFSRGWDQSLNDNNGAIDALGRFRYTLNKSTDISIAAICGPELDDDNSHYRTTIDLAVTHQCGDRWTLLGDAVYGYQAMPSGQSAAQWYGAAGYGVYQVNDYLSAGLRGEWYRDEQGLTTGVNQTLYEATAGVTIMPFPNNAIGQFFKVRPEIRYDYSTARYFDGGTRHDQTTVAIDAIFNF